nr:retrovirus-related Pol polyprotein from transposon TNT 1-94 [Tanacetum cinerariifolium]
GNENTTNPPTNPPTHQAPHTLSTIKLPILKKGEVLPPKTAEEILAKEKERERERKARTTLLMAISEDHLAKFHKMIDAKEMWKAIKLRFGRNNESKKMQKYIPKQQFEGFSVSPLKMPIRSFLGLNLLPGPKVFVSDVKGSNGSSSSTQNVAFVFSENTSSTNEVNTAYGVSTSSGHNLQKEGSSSYTDDLIYSFFANQSSGPQLDHGDLEQVDEFDLEEMDLKWQDEHKAMVTIDGEGVDWTVHAEDDTEDYALMAFNSSNLGSHTEDKSGLGYGSQIHDRVLSYENEVFESVFDSRSSDVEDSHVNDRFATVERMHAVPPPMTGNYMPHKSNFGINKSKFTYGPKQSTTSESDAKTNDLDSCESSSSKETLETVPKPVESKPKVVNEPKLWSDAPIIEEDCDFHEKRMAKQVELNKHTGKSTSPRENRPVWNNVQRLNHQNKFVPTTILTKTGRFPVNADRQSFSSQAVLTSIVRKVNTARPIVNEIRPRNNMYKSHSPIRRPFNRTTFSYNKVNTAGDKTVSAVGGNMETAVKASADYNGSLVAFGCSKGHITGKGKIRTGKLDFKDVCFVKELQHFNIFSVSQMCDKKNKALFTDTECLVLSSDFKLPDENQVLLRVPRQNNMYSFNLENIVPTGGIKREYSNDKTPQQNGVAEKKNRTLIEATKTMLANLFLPNTFWAKVVSTACYVLNRVLVTKPQNMTPYELITGKIPIISYIRPFGCHVTILNTIDHLGKFDGKSDEGFLVGYSLSSKAFRPITAENIATKTTGPQETNNNAVNAASILLNTASTPTNQDDSQIPSLEDIYEVSRDGIFTSASYDDEVAVVDFTNLEYAVNDERGVVVRNKARLVAQGHRQEKGIDYDEVFTPVARIEAIKIFLAFSSYMGFIVYQMDVKSAFLYDKIDEEVYVSQPPSFIDPKFPNKVYKVVKALYGLHQAPRAWYATLSTFLVQSRYRRGLIDKTLFIKKDKKDIMLVQVYVDDIIFGSTKESWCDEFEALMNTRFQMSSMGELTFFLGLQVKQKEDGIFISLDKYVTEILKKFDFMSVKTASTPIETKKPLVKDPEAANVDVHIYRSMIGSLMYLTASRPDLMDAYEKKLIQVLKIHTNDNVADLLTKALDVSRLGKKMQFGLVLGALNGGHISDRVEGALNLDELFSICTNLSNRVLALETVKDAQAAEIVVLKARIKKLEKKCKPSISHHKAWLKSVQRLSMKNRFGKKESMSKQGRKKDKPTLDDSTFDDLDADHGMDYMDIEEPMNEGRLSEEISQDKGSGEKRGSTKELVLLLGQIATKKMSRSDFDAAQIAKDAEAARLVYEEKLAELKREKEEYTIKERAKFLAETIAAQRRFKAEQRFAEIKSRPPTKTQLRNLMMTYMKNMGGYKHSQLKAKTFSEIQGLYERQKKMIDDFKPMDADDAVDKEKVLEEPNSTQVKLKQEGDEESIKKRPGRRLKMKATKKSKRQKTDSDLKEEEHLKTFLQIELYNLVMQRFETTFPEGVDLVLWDDLRTMFKETTDDDLWRNQEEWILKKRRYPLTKETLERMLALRLIVEYESEAVLDLLRFIQKKTDESGSYDGSEKDLKDLASPKQTALGKDISNPLIVDSLLKTIWLSVHHVIAMKHWLFQSKRLL